MQPFNYTLNTQGAGEAFTQGAQRTAGLMATAQDYQNAQRLATQQQQKAEADQYKRQRFQDVAQNPNSKEVSRLLIEFPELHEGIGKSLEFMSSEEKRSTQQVSYSVLSALEKNKPEAAVSYIDQQLEAARRSKDDAATGRLEMLRDSVISNPTGAKFGLHGILFSSMGGDKYAGAMKSLGENEREAELQPGLVEKGKADAEKARFDVRKTSAEAVIKEVEAKFAPATFGAELGLKKAQTNAANASASSSYASASASRATASRANAEAKQITSGIIPSEKRPEAESKFREEYAKRTAPYQEVKQSYGRVLSSKNDAAGDIALIFGYMKMLDPGSVVREGEFATAQNAAGIDTRMQNVYNKALRGERLTDGQRKMFKGQAENLYKSAAKQEEEVRGGIKRIASGYGLNTENIFYTPSEATPQAPAQPSAGGFKVLGVER